MQPLIYVWSKDRASQLHTFLSSINKNLVDTVDIEVLYNYSSESFRDGYTKTIQRWPDVKFTLQNDAKSQMIDSISKYNVFVIATDDTYMFKKCPTTFVDKIEDVFTFSFRCGLNTVIQNHVIQSYQPILTKYEDEGDTIKWNYSTIQDHFNYGYPFSMDMHAYKTSEVIDFIKKISFYRPPELEGNLLQFRRYTSQWMRSYKHSVCVNVPLNCMSGNTASMNISLIDINQNYLDGQDLFYINEDIVGCHQNLQIGYDVR